MTSLHALGSLVNAIRQAGGTFRRDGRLLMLRFGRLDADERAAVTVLLRRDKPDVLTLLDTETAMALFPGACAVACPTCGSTRWREVGDRAVCVVCRPAPASAAPSTRTASARRRRTVA